MGGRVDPDVAGFVDVDVQGRYNGRPATSDDTQVVFIARHPG